MSFEWHKRHEFAAVAEALEVSTDCVMTVAEAMIVTYTPTALASDEVPMMIAVLSPDPSTGVLAVMRRWQIGTLGEFKQSLHEMLDSMSDDDA
jgi:hypothetical protein